MQPSTIEYDYLNEDNVEVLVKHRFPWKVSEIVSLSLLVIAGGGLIAFVQPPFLGILFVLAAPYLAWVNGSRKKKSTLVLAMTPVGLRVYKGSAVVANPVGLELPAVTDMSTTRDLDGNNYVVLRGTKSVGSETESVGLKIPQRLYQHPDGVTFLEKLASENGFEIPEPVAKAMRKE